MAAARLLSAVLAGALLGCAAAGSGARPASERPASEAALDARIRPMFAAYDRPDAPGASVAVVEHGRIVYARAFGMADLEAKVPATVRTNYRLASVTKQFTAMAIMLLVRDGALRYDDRLGDIFPEFGPPGRAITVRHLLTHTSGLWDYEDILPPGGADDQIHDAGVLALLAAHDSVYAAPGARYSYSNSGYALLAMIVERRSGIPFARFLRERIFLPLGMTETVAYERGRSTVAHRAYGYTPDTARGGFRRTDQSRTSAVLGDGGIYSSVTDLAKWDAALAGDALVPPAMLREAWTPNRLTSGAATSYGYGWMIDTVAGTWRVRHDGTTIGFRNAIERYPERGLTVIVLCNRADARPTILADSIAALLLR